MATVRPPSSISVTLTPAIVSATFQPLPYKTHMSVSETEDGISLQGSQAQPTPDYTS